MKLSEEPIRKDIGKPIVTRVGRGTEDWSEAKKQKSRSRQSKSLHSSNSDMSSAVFEMAR